MPTLVELWLPIVVAAVFIFIASSVIHMATPIHKSDARKLPNEDDVLAAMRQNGLAPGDYMFPFPASMAEMSSPAMLEKLKLGPVGHLTVRSPGSWGIGPALMQWFAWTVLIGVLIAYVTTIVMPRGAPTMTVFRMTSAMALSAYAFTNVTASIWKGVRWSTTLKFVFDGVVYALLTGAAFAWLWPR